jgi:hypothetical protein
MLRSSVTKTKEEIYSLLNLLEKQGTSLFEATNFDRSTNVIIHGN